MPGLQVAALMMAATRARRASPIGNLPPTVNAGSDQSVSNGATVNLSASGADADGTITGYAWSWVSGPATPSFTNGNTANASFVPTVDGTYVARCTVTDNLSATGFDDVQVTVSTGAVTSRPSTPTIKNGYSTGTGNLSLDWVDPVSNIDGSALGAVLEAEMYYGTTSDQQKPGGTGTTMVSVTGLNTKAINSLTAATYFAALRYRTAAGWSSMSGEAEVPVS